MVSRPVSVKRSPINTGKSERHYDLDWLRVLAVLLLVPFHSALIFSLDPGDIVYVKDQVQSEALVQFAYFVHQWHMPLLFLIAGASTWFALSFRTGNQYLKERFTRLVIPLAFGCLVLVPPMIYVQFLGKPDFASFWEFYLQFFKINFEDFSGYSGTFTPGHLWFILFLFVFSVIALPLFLCLRREAGKQLIARLAAFFDRRGAIFLLAFPLAVTAVLPDLGGMPLFLYIILFVYGYILMSDTRFQSIVDRHTVAALVLGIISTAAVYTLSHLESSTVLIHLMYYLSRWCWLVAILGLGRRYLNANSKALQYASEASYPFYILHLLMNTLIAYQVVRWNADVAVKYLVINVATVLVTMAAYDLLVKRTNVTRFLFGMKLRKGVTAPRVVERTA